MHRIAKAISIQLKNMLLSSRKQGGGKIREKGTRVEIPLKRQKNLKKGPPLIFFTISVFSVISLKSSTKPKNYYTEICIKNAR